MTFRPGEIVYHRILPVERVTVVECGGCVAVVRTDSGETYPVPVGGLTRRCVLCGETAAADEAQTA